jgi:endonuclease YncB( thermonuclease family)
MQSQTNMLRTLAVGLLILASCPSFAQDLIGKAIQIADGDTFTLLTPDRERIQIRLAEIDAPEAGQPYGNRARQALSEALKGQDVRVVVQTQDRYGRTVGRPYVGDTDICAEMVSTGNAWVYREYLIERRLLELEEEARTAGRGLWGITEAKNTPPWEWRRQGGEIRSSNGCTIKGNINSKGQRIYHVPGSSTYGATRINLERGERWFCSEDEARAAGWRANRSR